MTPHLSSHTTTMTSQGTHGCVHIVISMKPDVHLDGPHLIPHHWNGHAQFTAWSSLIESHLTTSHYPFINSWTVTKVSPIKGRPTMVSRKSHNRRRINNNSKNQDTQETAPTNRRETKAVLPTSLHISISPTFWLLANFTCSSYIICFSPFFA